MTVIRGHIIPYVDENGIAHDSTTFTNDEMAIWARAFLRAIHYTWTQFNPKKKIKNETDLLEFGNLVVAMVHYFDISMTRKLFNSIYKDRLEVIITSKKFEEAFLPYIKNFLDFVPSDTRFGLNTTGLWYHMRTVSGIAWVLGKMNGLNELDVQKLRIGSMFHDIGKPFNWQRHTSKGVEVFKEELGDLFDNTVLQDILKIIEFHHETSDDILVQLARLADWYESSSARGSKLVVQMLRDEYKKKTGKDLTESFFKEGISVDATLNKELTEIYTRKVRLSKEYLEFLLTLSDEFSEKSVDNKSIALVKGDARGIKRYVDESLFIRELRGGSKLIDDATIGIAHYLIKSLKYPFEALLYYGGGNILFLALPRDIESLEEKCADEFRSYAKGADMTFAHVIINVEKDIEVPFGVIWNYLNRKLNFKKIMLTDESYPIIPGGLKRCSSCGVMPASKIVPEHAEEEEIQKYYYCDNCYTKYTTGSSILGEYLNKLEQKVKKELSEAEQMFIVNFNVVSKHLLEYIAGLSINEILTLEKKENNNQHLSKSTVSYVNYAVLKADGNLMGEFFGRSISLHDLFERSRCVSKAMDYVEKAVYDAFKDDPEIKQKLELGEIYLAGDDMLWIVPSLVAFKVAKIAIETFHRRLGYVKTLSVGMLVAPPKFPLPLAIKSAEVLLKFAKEKSRPYEYNLSETDDGKSIIGWLDYEIIEQSGITPDSLENIRATIRNISSRPLYLRKISEKQDYCDFKTLFEISAGNKVSIDSTPTDLINAINDSEGMIHENLRVFRHILGFFKSLDKEYIDEYLGLAVSYSIRQHARLDGTKKDAYLTALKLLEPTRLISPQQSEDATYTPKLLDAYIILKILKGSVV